MSAARFSMFASSSSTAAARSSAHAPQCFHCREENCIITDYTSGDVTCTSCGTVQEERMLADSIEYNRWCIDSHFPASGFGFGSDAFDYANTTSTGAPAKATKTTGDFFFTATATAGRPPLPPSAASPLLLQPANANGTANNASSSNHITPQRKLSVSLVNQFLEALNLGESFVATHAHDLRNRVMAAMQFKARPFVAAMACCVYLACRDSGQHKVPRSAQEVVTRLGIDAQIFHRVLKEILKTLPRETRQKDENQHVKVSDGIVRQIQLLTSVPLDRAYVVARRAMQIDVVRRQRRYMLASPPSTANAVLIALACESLKIDLDPNELVQQGWIALGTLKKHGGALRKWI